MGRASGLFKKSRFLYALTGWSMANGHTTAAAEDGQLRGVPWDSAHGRTVAALIATMRDSVRAPLAFFDRVAECEDRWVAVGYALLLDVVGHVLGALWTVVLAGPVSRESLLESLLAIVLSPLRVLLAVWLFSEVLHGALSFLRGARASRAVTHRAVAYCYGLAAVYRGVVLPPVVAGASRALGERLSGEVAEVAALVVLYAVPLVVYEAIAMRQVHKTRTWKAGAAVAATWSAIIAVLLLALLSGRGSEAS